MNQLTNVNARPAAVVFSMVLGLALITGSSPATAAEFDPVGLLEETGFSGGVVLVHEPESAGPLVQFAERGDTVVVAVAADADRRMNLRQAVLKARVPGRVMVVEPGADGGLPVIDHFANLVIDIGGGLEPGEAMRACAPFGSIWSEGQVTTKDLPENMDDWPEWDGGPDGNPVSSDTALDPPTTFRWSGGPGKHGVGGMSADVGFRFSNGVAVFSETGYIVSRYTDDRSLGTAIVARDAFSGVQLWRRATDGSADFPNRHGFVAVDGSVYAQLARGKPYHRIDIRTGETIRTYDQGLSAKPLPADAERKRHFSPKANQGPPQTWVVARVADGKLLQLDGKQLVALDIDSGKRLWTHHPKETDYLGWFVVGDGKVYLVESKMPWQGLRGAFMFQVDRIAALSIADGSEQWRWQGSEDRASTRLVYSRGDLFVPHFGKVEKGKTNAFGYSVGYGQQWRMTRLDGDTGKVIWSSDKDRGAAAHYQIALDHPKWGVVVAGQSGHRLDSETGAHVDNFGFAPYDGCGEVRGTPEYLFYTMDFLSFRDEGGKPFDLDPGLARSSCDVGSFPAYGGIHTAPSQCGCNDYPVGYNSFVAQRLPAAVSNAERLQRGPAFGTEVDGPEAPWPHMLGQGDRGGSTHVQGPSQPQVRFTTGVLARFGRGPVGLDWRQDDAADGPITPLTVGPEGVYTVDRRGGVVIALDPATGDVRWRYPTGGMIDAPPTVVGKLVVVGSHDGWVYALRAADGELAWRFLAARSTTQHLSGQDSSVVSRWPAGGSVLHHNGSLYVIAGRHSSTEQGLILWRLDPASGEVRGQARIHTDPQTYGRFNPRSVPDTPHGIKNYGGTRRGRDLLVAAGDQIVHRWEGIEADLSDSNVPTYDPPARAFGVERYRPEKPALRVRQYFLNTRRGDYGRYFYDQMRFRSTEQDRDGNFRELSEYLIAVADDIVVAGEVQLTAYPRDAAGRARHDQPLWRARPEGARTSVQQRGASRSADAIAISANHVYQAMANHALVVYDRATGEVVHFLELPDRVHKHGLAIGHGRLFAALRNGSVVSVADVAPGDVNIERFTANMAAATPDQTLTVAWSVANADSVTLNPGSRRLSASGSTAVEVEADQPIQLRAEGPGGAVTRTLPLRVMEPIAAEPIDDLKPGLRASYVSRDKDPSVTSTVPDLWQNHGGAFRDSGMNDNFAATFAGYVTVPKTGAYRFKLDTDDGGSLRIAGELVTANSAFGKSVGVIALEAGVHPIVASLEEGRGGAKIQVSWQGPGMEKLEPVPADAFGHHDR